MLLSPLPILAQATAFSGGPGSLIAQSGTVARVVLVILLIFSLVSWAIIIYKGIVLHRAHTQSQTFLQIFRKSSKFSEVNSVCLQLKASPLVGVFQAGYIEVNQQVRGGSGASATPAARPTVKSLEALSRSLVRAAGVEVTRIERRVSFLATTASVTPFVGLFGTVWGIMTAFADIGRMGSANLAVVAPGISEALITTAMGLAAAIPAAVFFNFYSSRIKVLTAMMDDFALEFLNIVERNFT
ncbi:MAG TPA: MotA/TolQ/ExbB proton channel family protein [Vicinamibacteria bacterium]|nr:MotA/TolQ/ExbB proton channel family protein [Vicinamibacteria bacterium]